MQSHAALKTSAIIGDPPKTCYLDPFRWLFTRLEFDNQTSAKTCYIIGNIAELGGVQKIAPVLDFRNSFDGG